MKSVSTFASLLIASLPLTGCLGSPGAEAEDLGTAEQAILGDNGLSWNGLTQNGLTQNGLTQNGLTQNGLTQNGLTQNGLVADALSDPLARLFLKYVVSCALPADQHIDIMIDGTPFTFSGQLGLAPSWGLDNGTCDAACVAWVSGCVLSRVNYLGESVPISMRGSAGSLASSSSERATYPNREGSYYGNIFVSPQQRFACTSPGSTLIERVCGPSTGSCIMTVVGDCDQVCDAPDPTEASYPNCRDNQSTTYPGSVTIFRQ